MDILKNMFSKGNKVIMYASDTCGDCQAAKKYFMQQQVDVDYKNIANEEVRDELVNKYGRKAVPTIVVGDKVFLGFSDNKVQIKELLNLD